MSEKSQAETILAALNAALAPVVAYEYDKVPGAYGNAGTRPTKYVVVDISRRYVEKRRGDGSVSIPGGRVGIRYAAKATNDVRNMRELALTTLEDKTLGSGATEVGPFCWETGEAILPDDGYQSGSDTFTF